MRILPTNPNVPTVTNSPCKKVTGILAGSRQESRFPPRSRRDLASPGIFPPGSRQEKNPAINPAGTPTGNLCLHRDPATNPDYPKIPPGSCQPGYFPAGIPSGKNSRSDSCRESLSSPGSRQGNKIFPARCFLLAGLDEIKAF